MKVPAAAQMIEVRCDALDRKNLECRKFLGYFQVNSAAHTSIFFCKYCNCLHKFSIDESGILHRERSMAKLHLADTTVAMVVA